jgi:hypothetical protein
MAFCIRRFIAYCICECESLSRVTAVRLVLISARPSPLPHEEELPPDRERAHVLELPQRAFKIQAFINLSVFYVGQ